MTQKYSFRLLNLQLEMYPRHTAMILNLKEKFGHVFKSEIFIKVLICLSMFLHEERLELKIRTCTSSSSGNS